MDVNKFIEVRYPLLHASPLKAEYIQIAYSRLNSKAIGKNYSQAVALLACHLFCSDNPEGSDSSEVIKNSGNITSLSEGQLSVSFDNSATKSAFSGYFADYGSTRYGKELIGLLGASVFCPMNRIVQ